jgi:hypothetical protein
LSIERKRFEEMERKLQERLEENARKCKESQRVVEKYLQ